MFDSKLNFSGHSNLKNAVMKPNLLKYAVVLLCLVCTAPVFSVPAVSKPLVVTQPDGSTLTLYLRGDEFFHFHTSEDNYLIKQDTDGYYKYATVVDGKITISSFRAREISERTADELKFLEKISPFNRSSLQVTSTRAQRSSPERAMQRLSTKFPAIGSPRSLVILVNFADKHFVTPNAQDAFYKLLNQEDYSDNGGTGSARDYFIAASSGQFLPDFVVVGPYTLPRNMNYYGANDMSGEDRHPVDMIVDACVAADSDVDFAEFDEDNDTYIDNVFVYYAGYNEAEWGGDDTVWPHRWTVSPGYNYADVDANVTFDGKVLFDYACTSELRGKKDSLMCGIGTFAHEFGHVLGLPDYYKTNGESGQTLGDWSIMDHGSYNNDGCTPPTYSAYDRFYLGWLDPTELTTPDDLTLYPLNQSETFIDSNQAFLLADGSHNMNRLFPSPSEFFLLEYRKNVAWDTYLGFNTDRPEEGLLIWHIDYDTMEWLNNSPNNYSGTTGSVQTESDHMRVFLHSPSSPTVPGRAFTSGSFVPVLWSGDTLMDANVVRLISDINLNDDSLTFKFMGGKPSIEEDVDASNFFRITDTGQAEVIKQTDDILYVYTTDGQLVYSDDSEQTCIQLPLEKFKKGYVYILNAGKYTAKWIY